MYCVTLLGYAEYIRMSIEQVYVNCDLLEWYAGWPPWVAFVCFKMPRVTVVLYATLLHLRPSRFQCVGGCWDRYRTVATLALTVGRSNHLARSRVNVVHAPRGF